MRKIRCYCGAYALSPNDNRDTFRIGVLLNLLLEFDPLQCSFSVFGNVWPLKSLYPR
jgi:hypothetical protein